MLSLWWQQGTHKWHEHGQENEVRGKECSKVWQERTTKERKWPASHPVVLHLLCKLLKSSMIKTNEPTFIVLQHSSVLPAEKACICKSRASLNTHRTSNGMEQTGELPNGKLSFTSTDIRHQSWWELAGNHCGVSFSFLTSAARNSKSNASKGHSR